MWAALTALIMVLALSNENVVFSLQRTLKKSVITTPSVILKPRIRQISRQMVMVDKSQSFLHLNTKFNFKASLSSWKSLLPSSVALIGSDVAKELSSVVRPGDFFFFLFFSLTYTQTLKLMHRAQKYIWKKFSIEAPYDWDRSVLGFIEERCGLLMKLIGCDFTIRILMLGLTKIGFNFRSDFPLLVARVSYALYATHFVDLFKSRFLHTFFPSLMENRRRSYVVNKSSSVIVWFLGGIIACEMVSTYLKIPLSSTLAFGGVGGLAIGLSARDIAANFLGGMLLLFNEPFTPGDMISFRIGTLDFLGRVERVGWGQTRLRGSDTRSTYIPNSHFVQTPVTNIERITHWKFETVIPLRYQDSRKINDVVAKMKENLKTIPKLDALSQPFRVSFYQVSSYSLDIKICCYFATKSLDEFLNLQQSANSELIKAVYECGAELSLPTTNFVSGGLHPNTSA